MRTILTLDARNYLLLASITEQFGMTGAAVQSEIYRTHDELLSLLQSKGLQYEKFKSSLVPSKDRYECAFIFDTGRVGGTYGIDIADRLIPLLNPAGNCSISSGDILAHGNPELVWSLMTASIYLARSAEIHLESLYCVYLNNQTRNMIESIDRGLEEYEPYLGFIPTRSASPVRAYLSTTVSQGYVKIGRDVIGQHEPDADPRGDWNLLGWQFEKHGYRVKSIPEVLYSLFLTYKIERPAPYSELSDTRFSLNALSSQVTPLSELSIQVEEAKARYVTEMKGGSLARAGLRNLSSDALVGLIKSKIEQNYIYMFQDKSQFGALLFDLILEVPHETGEEPVRFLCSLNYRPQEKVLKLVTLF